jgi:hypothetical protein
MVAGYPLLLAMFFSRALQVYPACVISCMASTTHADTVSACIPLSSFLVFHHTSSFRSFPSQPLQQLHDLNNFR